MTTGVIALSNAFFRHLRQETVSLRFAPLQLTGRLEDYLVKEFMQFVFWESKGTRFCDSNLGVRGEQKVDIVIRRALPGGREVLEAFVEARYLRNSGRRSTNPSGKFDEIRSTLKSLRRQLEFRPLEKHGKSVVRVRAKTFHVYGLVFAGYSRLASDETRPDEFIKRILGVGKELGLRYHDLPRPYFRRIYTDRVLFVLGRERRVSLWGGLWCADTRPNTYEDSSRQETKISSTLKNRTTRKSANKKYSRRSRSPS